MTADMTADTTATAHESHVQQPLAVLDYGAGNLASFEGALLRLNVPFMRVTRASELPTDLPLALPGVGHFLSAKRALCERGLWDVIAREGAQRGVLGICLGLQLLAEGSEEAPGEAGLGLLQGTSIRFQAPEKVPHMGWNELTPLRKHAAYTEMPEWAYFVHSYALPVTQQTVQRCHYGAEFTASAAHGRVIGMQHHPEKSSADGLLALARAARWLTSGSLQSSATKAPS
jgi:imidazole glycerol-phosphate synthase subunit HisH